MAKPLISTISVKGQTTIPVSVRRALEIGAGDAIRYDIEGDGVRIVKAVLMDLPWANALHPTLAEWEGEEDDDL
jgi:antitoxin PrlF